MKPLKVLCIIGLTVFFGSGMVQADIYSWTDENGVLHFSDSAPSPAFENVTIFEAFVYDAVADRNRMAAENAELEAYRKTEEKQAAEAAARKAAETRMAEIADLTRAVLYATDAESTPTADVTVLYIGQRYRKSRNLYHRAPRYRYPRKSGGMYFRYTRDSRYRHNKYPFYYRPFDRKQPYDAYRYNEKKRYRQAPGRNERGYREHRRFRRDHRHDVLKPRHPVPRSGGAFPTDRRNRYGEWNLNLK